MPGKVRELNNKIYVVVERMVTSETDSTETTTRFRMESIGTFLYRIF